MPLIPNIAVFQRKLAGFPIATYRAGQTVLTAASTTGRLLILKKGAVAVLREGVEIATVTEPGAVFGELSVLLDLRTRRMYVRWRPRSFTSPMRPPYSG
jgi:CRP/FNR family transcriptional regulator, cyclic AMP receptor protein